MLDGLILRHSYLSSKQHKGEESKHVFKSSLCNSINKKAFNTGIVCISVIKKKICSLVFTFRELKICLLRDVLLHSLISAK